MDKIRTQLSNPLVTAIAGFVLGLIIGLPILGWWLVPVQWTDAAPSHLRADAQNDYMRMAIDSYGKNKNETLAKQRFAELGDGAAKVLQTVQNDPALKPADVAGFAKSVGVEVAVAAAPTQAPAEGQPTAKPSKATKTKAPAATQGAQATAISPDALLQTLQPSENTAVPAGTTAQPATRSSLITVLIVLCLATLVVGGVLVYLLIFRKRGSNVQTPVRQAQEASRQAEKTDFASQGQEAPVAQFMSTYVLGDDLYDDSFSIDSPTGEFLGECGIGISETIGVGDPKKVTAFEVWLFDKNDIQTVTKVLMSEHAFNDPTIAQRLASKGEPVMVQPNQRVLLETATLQLEARVVDSTYGQGALPANSFFERMTLELAIWPKPKAE